MRLYYECMIGKRLVKGVDEAQLRWLDHDERITNERVVKAML